MCDVHRKEQDESSVLDYAVCSETLRRDIAQAFASRPSVGRKLVHCSMSEFSDVSSLRIYSQGPINLLISGLTVSSVGLFPC